jgi:LuxR family maltose regulon positive regulatory protein
VVSAPAGYGKTTLVSDWIVRFKVPAAWLSLDASDNDLSRFFSYLIAALQQIDPAIGADIEPILETGADLSIEPLLTALVNDIAALTIEPSTVPPWGIAGQNFVLVLDDYHLITDFSIHEALDFLFDHLPPGMHVVILSRTDPPMPLGRLRVQRELTEIRETDLQFTIEETTAFFNDLMELELAPEDIKNLAARTEGWIAGLQLAALTLQGRADKRDLIAAFSGSHRHLIDYLAHEVLSRQPDRVQAFLLRTSILERFKAPLCDAVCFGLTEAQSRSRRSDAVCLRLAETPSRSRGSDAVFLGQAETANRLEKAATFEGIGMRPGSDASEMLVFLEKANLFLIPLDDERRWYRYHHLFTDFLRQYLHETQPEIFSELHLRASHWYEANGMMDEAIEHALAGGDTTQAARLLCDSAEVYIFNAEIDKVIQWANRLPAEVRCKCPRLCIYHAWALQFEYQLEAAESALALAEGQSTDPGELPLAESPSAVLPFCPFDSQVASHASAIRGYMALQGGEFDQAVGLLLSALDALPETGTDGRHPADKEHPADQMRALRGAITLGLGIGYFELGQMEAAYQALESALPLNQQAGNRYGSLSCIYSLMHVDIARGALNQARANGEKGLLWIEEWSRSQSRKKRPARMLAHLRWQMGRVQYERNQLDQAARNLSRATDFYELVQSWYRVRSYVHLLDLYQAMGDVEAALGYLRKLERISLRPGFSLPDSPVAAQIAERSLLLRRLRPDQGDLFAEAVRWAETSGLGPNDEFRYEQEYEYLTLARVLIAQDKAEEAIPLLDRLIVSAESAGRTGQLIAYLALQAVAHHSRGQRTSEHKTGAAFAYLSRAFALGEPEGYVRTFVDLGPPMRDLLLVAGRRGIAPGYVPRLLAAFPDLEPDSIPSPAARPKRRQIEDLVEPLTDREVQILRRLAAGLTNRQIAEELYLSINTIKWYTTQIYGKLEVSRRAEAVARAHELSIL